MRSSIRLRSVDILNSFTFLRGAQNNSWDENFSSSRDTNTTTHASLVSTLNEQQITKAQLETMHIGYKSGS
jgi:hypothetical protein